MSYGIIEHEECDRTVKTSFMETYGSDGNVWVTMKVELSGDQPYYVDFDNPSQIEECMRQMENYLKRRNKFSRSAGEPAAAEPECNYD